ncbi:MAG: zinc ribbon domain-containing protein [Cyanobacteriota bacterium]|nr:zinc ribbon domain-containing protein [Cyanobacteriota bacterium]
MPVLSPSRGPERLVRIGQWAIALLFAYFLIQVGGSLIADLPQLGRAPERQQFLDRAALERLEADLKPLRLEESMVTRQQAQLAQREQQARDSYERDQRSFETWRSARSVTEQSSQNPEVLERARRLDQQLNAQRQLASEASQLAERRQAIEQRIAPLEQQSKQLQERADRGLASALQRHQLTALAIRLAFVLPVLALALHLFRRHRSGDQWPFVWGFLLFALFAFFVELVPYLPSFGGYIRYGIGALLTFLGGRALMRWLHTYMARQQQEQQAPQEERQLRIRYEKALQSVGQRQCPGCERQLATADAALPDYCMHCGLPIQADCSSCGHHHLAFFPFCPACGTPRRS